VPATREQAKTVFTTPEALLFGVLVVAALAGIYGPASGWISI